MTTVDIIVEDERWTALGDPEALAQRAIATAFEAAGYEPGSAVEVSLLLADDATVQALNRDWRGKDEATNVLSFPSASGPAPDPTQARHLGDLALAFETLAREAEVEGKSLPDHALHLIVHGTLHLLGYDHEVEAAADIMEGIEVEALGRIGVANPYRDMAV